MTVLKIDAATKIDLADVVTIDFQEDASSPLGERAELLMSREGRLVPAAETRIDSIPSLQLLREAIGNGTGETRWVRIRQEGTTGDHADAYANLDAVGDVAYGTGPDGPVARLHTTTGIPIGEVHLPAALEAVRGDAPRRK